MILTKSISRFSRNTLDCLKYVRLLKEIGVDVYFEEQGIHSTDPGAEFYITIFGSIAQTESENISANVRWGKAQSAKEGNVAFSYKSFLTKKMKSNEGEVPQYFVEHSHPPIIDPSEFELVQVEIARRQELGKRYSSNNIFSAKIVCGDCGEFYGAKVWHSNSKYKRTIYQCTKKYEGKKKCSTPHFYEDDIKSAFLEQFNALIENKDEILDNCRLVQATLTDCTAIDKETNELLDEIEVVSGLTKKWVEENSSSALDQEEYENKYATYVKRYDTAKAKLDTLQIKRQKRLAKHDLIGGFMFELMERDRVLTEFDARLFGVVVDNVVATSNGGLEFVFRMK